MIELRDILIHVPLLRAIPVWGLLFMSLTASAEVVDVRPVLIEKGGSLGVEYRSGTELVGRSTDAAPAGVELLLPDARSAPVPFQTKAEREGVIELGPAKVGTYLLAGVHGLPTAEVDALLAERIAREIIHVPAFNESISTVTG